MEPAYVNRMANHKLAKIVPKNSPDGISIVTNRNLYKYLFGINKARHPLERRTVRRLRLVPQYVVVPNFATRIGFVN